MNILTLNSGSNSLKFEIVASDTRDSFGTSLISGVYDNIGKDNSVFALLENKQPRTQEKVQLRDHGHATELLLDWIDNGGVKAQGLTNLDGIERVAYRIVHGADLFDKPAEITEDVIRQIQELEDLAPLHNASALQVIQAARSRKGFKALMVAVFDTVFHRTIPDHAALYPIAPEVAKRHRIRRYGFHGISHRYMSMRYAQLMGRPLESLNIITLHLEGGSSAAAIRQGKSVDTSMGFTPLEGLMMGTRCGDIDPAIVSYLMRKEKMDSAEIESFLNKKCGLLAVSGTSADTRELLKQLDNPDVELALDMFCYRVRKYVGGYLAALGGAEAIVIGGGIGENTPAIRERIFKNFDWCGATLDLERNRSLIDSEGAISTLNSSIQLWVVPTQENMMMARDVFEYAPN